MEWGECCGVDLGGRFTFGHAIRAFPCPVRCAPLSWSSGSFHTRPLSPALGERASECLFRLSHGRLDEEKQGCSC